MPGVALALQAAWALVLVLSGTYTELLRYVVSVEFVVLILLVDRGFRPAAPRACAMRGRTGRGGIRTPRACSSSSRALSSSLLGIASPRTTLPGFGLVLAGIPVFFVRRAKRRAA